MTKKHAVDKTPITPAPTGEATPAPVYPDGTPIPAEAVAACEALPPAVPAPKVPRPTVGRLVLYAMKDRNGVIQSRPAIVVNVFERTDGEMPLINLQVLSDGANDKRPDGQHLLWETSRHYDEGCAEGTWHWMPFQLGQAAKVTDEVGPLRARIEQLEKVLVDLGDRIGHPVKL